MNNDQKRALGIGALGIGGLLVYRRLHSPKGTTQLANTQASVSPYTPQASVPLSPGQSVYDPNSEALLTTPTAGYQDIGGGVYGPSGTSQEGTVQQATTPAAPHYTINVIMPKNPTVKRTTRKPATRTVNVRRPTTPHTKNARKKKKVTAK